jgi:hypothetical protein
MKRKVRLSELMDLLVFDGEESVAKPGSCIYQHTVARLDVQPEEIMFVDNSVFAREALEKREAPPVGRTVSLFLPSFLSLVDRVFLH